MSKGAIGIIGAGKLGMTLAQLGLKAGYKVYISGSGDPSKIKLTVDALAPGAVAMSNEEVAASSEVVVLALPLGKFRQLSAESLAGKLVVDATNYWWEVDGPRDDILPSNQSTSQAVQEYFRDARVVKALSHMGYHHLYDESRPAGVAGRKAIAVAGDSQDDVAVVSKLVDAFGFDPVYIGLLKEGARLEPGTPAFGVNVDKSALTEIMQLAR